MNILRNKTKQNLKKTIEKDAKKKRLRAKQSKAELARKKKFLYHKRYLIRSNSLVIN